MQPPGWLFRTGVGIPFLGFYYCPWFSLFPTLYDVYKLLSVIVAFDCTQVPRITLINTLYLYPSVISWAESDTAGDFPFYACLCFSVLSSAAVQLKGATFSFVESEEVTLAFPLTNSVIWNSLINKQVNWSEWSAKQRSGLESFHETRVSVEWWPTDPSKDKAISLGSPSCKKPWRGRIRSGLRVVKIPQPMESENNVTQNPSNWSSGQSITILF